MDQVEDRRSLSSSEIGAAPLSLPALGWSFSHRDLFRLVEEADVMLAPQPVANLTTTELSQTPSPEKKEWLIDSIANCSSILA